MNVGIIGAGGRAEARRRAVEALPAVRLAGVLSQGPLDPFLAQVDAVFVAGPTAQHFPIAEAATKRGVHVFLEWPPATSIRECKAMVQLSEEAGVEVGVSRPLRFHGVFAKLPEAWRASLIVFRREVAREADAAWPRWLADAVDLCCALAQSSSVQRIDAEAVRHDAPWPEAVAFGLRFHSGAYAQVSLRRSRAPAAGALYVGGPGFEVEADFEELAEENVAGAGAYVAEPSVEAETQAFLRAVARQRPAPVSILDGLHTMRLVERLMEKLR